VKKKFPLFYEKVFFHLKKLQLFPLKKKKENRQIPEK